MTNPFNGLYLYKIEYEDGCRSQYRDLIAIAYQGKSGIVRAYHGYGDRILAKVGGYGYDKIHTALAEAIEKLTGVDLQVNGAAGAEAVIEAARSHDIKVFNILVNAINA